MNERVANWKREIAESGDGTTRINIAYEFSDIFAKNMIKICFGRDMMDRKFKFDFMTDKSKPAFETRDVTLLEALNNVFEQLTLLVMSRTLNPISLIFLTLFSIELDLHWSSSIVKENCRRLR